MSKEKLTFYQFVTFKIGFYYVNPTKKATVKLLLNLKFNFFHIHLPS